MKRSCIMLVLLVSLSSLVEAVEFKTQPSSFEASTGEPILRKEVSGAQVNAPVAPNGKKGKKKQADTPITATCTNWKTGKKPATEKLTCPEGNKFNEEKIHEFVTKENFESECCSISNPSTAANSEDEGEVDSEDEAEVDYGIIEYIQGDDEEHDKAAKNCIKDVKEKKPMFHNKNLVVSGGQNDGDQPLCYVGPANGKKVVSANGKKVEYEEHEWYKSIVDDLAAMNETTNDVNPISPTYALHFSFETEYKVSNKVYDLDEVPDGDIAKPHFTLKVLNGGNVYLLKCNKKATLHTKTKCPKRMDDKLAKTLAKLEKYRPMLLDLSTKMGNPLKLT